METVYVYKNDPVLPIRTYGPSDA